MVDLYRQALHKVDHISRRLEKNLVLQAQTKLLQKQNQNNNPAPLLKSNQFLYYICQKNYFGLNYFEFKVARPLVRGPKVRWLDSDTLNCTIESKVKTFFGMRPSQCTITELLEVYAYLILEFAQSNNVPMQTKNGVIETFFKFAAQVDDTLQNQLVIARTIRTMAMNTDIIPTLIRCGAVKTLETYASSMYNSRQLDTIVAWGCLNLAFTSEGRFALNNNGFKNTLQKLYSRSVFEDAKEMIYNAQTRLNVPYGFNAVDLYAPYPLR